MPEIRLSDVIAPAFYPVHQAIVNGATEVWLPGGRGSTKSTDASAEGLLILHGNPMTHGLVTRRYANDLRRSVFAQVQWTADKLGVYGEWEFLTSPLLARNKRTAQTIMFEGADDPTKIKSIKVPFGYIGWLWCEELDQFGGPEELRSLEQSVIRGGQRQVRIYTFNPPKSDRSWVNVEADTPKPGRMVFRTTYLGTAPEFKDPVPREWLGDQFYADAEYLKRTNEPAYRHEYLGERTGTGVEVFKNVKLTTFTDDECRLFTNVRQGLDWGYANDPLWFGRASYDRKRRRLAIFHEYTGLGIGNRKLDNDTPDEWKSEVTYADSSEPKSIDEMRGEYGWKIIPAEKGPGSVESGIKWLQELEEIAIDPARCPRAAKEFTNYALDIARDGTVVSKFPDRDNHAIDAVRYLSVEWRRPELKAPVKVVPLPTVSHW